MQFFIVSFSASRLNALGFLPFLAFSFFGFLLEVGESGLKKEFGVELPLDWTGVEVTNGCLVTVGDGGSSSLSSSASNGFCSVSRSTFDLSWVTTCLRLGSC